jgi:hypothetical protein
VTASGSVTNPTDDTEVVDVTVALDSSDWAGTEVAVAPHQHRPFSVDITPVKVHGHTPICSIKRARLVQSVPPGNPPDGPTPGPTITSLPTGSAPTR